MTKTSTAKKSPQNKQVLVAVDFSEDSRAALLWACRHAECIKTDLVILHVVHEPASSPGFYHLSNQSQLLSMQEVAELMMAEFMDNIINTHAEPDVLGAAKNRFVTGLPPGRIIEVADEIDAELIVVGSRGMTGLPHLMLGSVAERVVELATIPVVVVKAKTRDKTYEEDIKKMQAAVEKRLKAAQSGHVKQADSDE
jgi:nucleotide-binding universal stress UspA family protein